MIIIEPWSKGLVFLKARRECLRWSLRTADPHTVLAYTQDGYAAPSHTRVLLTRGPYCLSLTTNEQLGFERGSTSSGFNRKKPHHPHAPWCIMVLEFETNICHKKSPSHLGK
jgi:hypothetical protein